MSVRGETSNSYSRMVGVVALGAGVAFVAGEGYGRVKSDIDSVACATGAAYVVNIIDLFKWGLMGVTLLLLVWILGDDLSRTASIVGRVAGIGFVVTGVANGIEHCAHIEALGLLYVSGLLLGLVGTAVFGVLLARSGAVPAWMGWVLLIGVLGFFASAEQGGVVFIGIASLAVGVRLVRAPPATHPAG